MIDDEPLDRALLDWLLDNDPALRWRVERDLVGAPQEVWAATRARVATEGFGAELLSHQDPDGQWAGGAYFPADFDWNGSEEGQPYTATTWSLNTLRDWGVESAVLAGTAEKLATGSRWEYDDLPYWVARWTPASTRSPWPTGPGWAPTSAGCAAGSVSTS